jgi:hypothetical protein
MKRPSKPKSRVLAPRAARPIKPSSDRLLADVRGLIEAARQHVAQAVNSTLVTLYWHIGRRVHEDILHQQRAEYGKQIVSTLSKQLTLEYGSGYSRPNLFRMAPVAEAFPDENTVSALRRQLSSEYGCDNSSPVFAGRRPCRSPSPGHRPGDRSPLLPICRPNGPRVRRTVGPLGRQHRFDSSNFPRAMPWAGRTAPLRGRHGIAAKSSRRRKMPNGERNK